MVYFGVLYGVHGLHSEIGAHDRKKGTRDMNAIRRKSEREFRSK